MAINPPVVDRNVPAFITSFNENEPGDYLKIYFYFQSVTNNSLNTQVVLAQVLEGNKSMFKSATYEPFIVWADEENLFTTDRYYIEVPVTLLKKGKFTVNSMISIQLMSFSNNILQLNENFFQILQARIWDRSNESLLATITKVLDGGASKKEENGNEIFYRSQWSTPSFMYPIAAPTFSTYGGLTQDQIEDRFALTEDAKEVTQLEEEGANPLNVANKYYFKSTISFAKEEEDDDLVAYEVQLLGLKNLEKTTTISISETKTTEAFATREVIETTNGKVYIDGYWDSSRLSFWHGLDYDFLEKKYDSYELVVIYFTRKGYKAAHSYQIKEGGEDSDTDTSTDTERYLDDLVLTSIEARPAPEKGAIHVTASIRLAGGAEGFNDTGVLIFERAIDENIGLNESADLKWKTCFQTSQSLNLTQTHPEKKLSFDDVTVEPGEFYKYRVKFKNWNESEQTYEYASGIYDVMLSVEDEIQRIPLETPPVILFIEDIFLATRDLTLKVRYNPDLTSYKRNVVDIITPTLGGAYPFVRRNGAQRYRTFNLGGLISYNSELYEPTSNDWLIDSNYHPELKEEIDDEFYNSLFIKTNGKYRINTKRYNNLMANGIITREEKRIIYEKLFRDMVMDFLYDDHVILFKSQSEGNIFIRLSNVSLTPNKQLGRHIYSFTATATEVLDTTLENYLEYFSTDYNDDEDIALQNVYILSAFYQYEDGVLYFGEFGTENSAETIIDNDIQTPDTWNKTEVQDNTLIPSVHIGSVTTKDTDTWGVKVSEAEGNLPVVEEGSYNEQTTDEIAETAFDLHLEETSVEGTQEV